MKLGTGRRWPAWVAVVGLHLGLALLLWQHRPPAPHASDERRLVTLRLLPPDRPPAPARPAPSPPLLRAPLLPAITPVPAPKEEAPPATTAPAPPAAMDVPPPAEPARTTLRLTLPPGYAASSAAARNPALSDPRSNTARPSFEERIAEATGGEGAWVEEPKDNHSLVVGALGDRRTVLRRGNTCVEVHRSRIADMDAFNGNVAPRTVAMMGKPYKCK